MKEKQDYIQDLEEIRSMMERSTKFLSLSGVAGILAGLYALAGSWFAYSVLKFYPNGIFYSYQDVTNVLITAGVVLILALISAFLDSRFKAQKNNENAWNATSRRLLTSMAAPLMAGGILILILINNGLIGLAAPLTLLFYGLALFNAGNYTMNEVRVLGCTQIILGLLNLLFIEFGLLFWTIGFGAVHILYGMFMYIRYER